ncbi:MAG: T9SS type A sorting domain-containing protein [Bacteroidales bacterium]|jgi:hypothetical protein|nr:T9SS type A sorting domain-containing protein [Bacteroidales bacterium]
MKKNKSFCSLIFLLLFNTGVFAQYNVGTYDGFAYTVLGSWGNEVPLPIELLWFTAECEAPNVTLNWATASESNNDFFTIERSSDCLNFDIIGTVAGAGNSNQTLYYYFKDANANNGMLYYRLKQTDFDGSFEYSKPISVICNDELLEEIKVYPNPVTDELTIEAIGNNEVLNFEIINPMGEVVCKNSFVQKTTVQTSKLAKGAYVVKIENGQKIEFIKIVKQ